MVYELHAAQNGVGRLAVLAISQFSTKQQQQNQINHSLHG